MDSFAMVFTIFVLAAFIGFEVISKVPPTLTYPTYVGIKCNFRYYFNRCDILSAGAQHSWLTIVLGVLAVILATINVVGGFMVTNRMLEMFRRKD